MPGTAAGYQAYKRVDIETASQGKLVVMLLNGAIQRAQEAKRQLERHDAQGAHNNLIRAQEIITEIRGALNMNAGEIAHNLDRLYEYFQHLLIQANVRKDPEPLDAFIEFVTSIRDTWDEVFKRATGEGAPASSRLDERPDGLINIRG